MNNHTPTPWAHRNGRIFAADRENLTIANIARSFDGDYSPENGEHIVRCVNSHEALVKALKDLISAINLDHPDAHEAVASAEASACAAIAAAGAPK